LFYHLIPLVLFAALRGYLLRNGLRMRLGCSSRCIDICLHLSSERTMRRSVLGIHVSHEASQLLPIQPFFRGRLCHGSVHLNALTLGLAPRSRCLQHLLVLAHGKTVPKSKGSSLWKLYFVFISLNARQDFTVRGLLAKPLVDVALWHFFYLIPLFARRCILLSSSPM